MTLEAVLPTTQRPNDWQIHVWNSWAASQIDVFHYKLLLVLEDLLAGWGSLLTCDGKRQHQVS